MILMPAIIWKPGKPNVRIRKAGIVCIIRLVEEKLIEEEISDKLDLVTELKQI